jgi:uncharacterized protein YggE
MEAQYFEKEAKTENPIIKILMVMGIVFLLVATIFTFFAIQNTSKQTKYLGSTSGDNTVNVSETGTVYAVPDVALVTFTTITGATTIDAALANNREKSNRIIDFLKRQNVNDTDMKTVDFNVYPKYEWQTKGIDLTVYPLGKRVIVGYEAVESIEATVRDNDQIGRTIQGSIEAGASQVSGLRFIISNEADFKKQAREQAITNAKIKADEIAKNLNVKLGNPISFTESYFSPVYSSTEKSTAGTGSNLQIVVGENKIEVTVNVSYEIR